MVPGIYVGLRKHRAQEHPVEERHSISLRGQLGQEPNGEGLARKILGEQILVQSAGSEPTTINPHAVEVMRELGVDIATQRSKSVLGIDPASVDVVITLCAEEVCPMFLGEARRLRWPLPDPVIDNSSISRDAMLVRFHGARDELVRKILEPAQEEGWAQSTEQPVTLE